MTLPTRAEALAAIERAEKATKGPWGPHEMPPLSGSWRWYEIGLYPEEPVAEVNDHHPNIDADAEFIGHARTDVPTFAQAFMEAMTVIEAYNNLNESPRAAELLAAYHAQEKPE